MMFHNKRILCVAAHPDDVEFGCGGTIAKYSKNNEIYSIFFAPCLEDPENTGILQEYQDAMRVLGVKKTIKNKLPRDILEEHKQEIRNILHELKMTFNPDVVFCPSLGDLHQDHRTVADCCLTIFRDTATILAYEVTRSTKNFDPKLYVPLSDENVKKKSEALQCYKTQKRKSYFKPEIFKALATFRGSQINNVEYAEAFEVMRMIDK